MLPEGALSPVNGVLSPNNCCKHNFTEALEYCKIQLPGSRVSEADGRLGTRGFEGWHLRQERARGTGNCVTSISLTPQETP
jgi:hypothetical protein